MMRLDKLLAHNQYGSRRYVKKLIRDGNVLVNGEVVIDDDVIVDEIKDEVVVFGDKIEYQEDIYIMMNKPQGVITANVDPRHKTVIDLLEGHRKEGLIMLGRLDKDTEGLLIITNNKGLFHDLLSPKKNISKKYYVEFSGDWSEDFYKDFAHGITLVDGYKTLPAEIEQADNKAYVTIYEGKYHQVKRMFGALGLHVEFLKRVEFNKLKLDESLAPGEYRNLSEKEIKELKKVL